MGGEGVRAAKPTVTARGVDIPAIGLGTANLKGEVARRIVGYALAIGYRHLDTAQIYGNETEIGAAIAASSVPRADIWLTTKVSFKRFRDGDLQRSVEESVRRLKTEPDLALLHWPNPEVPLAETLGALNQVRQKGLTAHIGLSNFTTALMRDAAALSQTPLIANQVEYHPYLSQRAVLEALRASDMALTAYSPLAKGKVFRDPKLRQIGARHGKTAGQAALRWLVQQDGVTAIPRSSQKANVKANLEVFDFELTAAEMDEISALGSRWGRMSDPLFHAPAWDGLSAADQVRRKTMQVARAVANRITRRFR